MKMVNRIHTAIAIAAVSAALPLAAQTSRAAKPAAAPSKSAQPASKPGAHAKPAGRVTKTAPALGAFKPAGAVHHGAGVELPAGATKLDPSSWRWTDPQGTAWIYRKTPFGMNRYRESDERKQAERAQAAGEPNAPRVKDLGDSYQFQKTTPFGTQTWTTKKSQMTESDKQVLKEAQASNLGSQGKQ
ncbi:MAG TPA: hypothetical protein VHD76_12500 [Bryobacteraceae bacterium]|jgi:hypothetical protein|nr:hypothetical protein [Bryobacteraceae bacterium]